MKTQGYQDENILTGIYDMATNPRYQNGSLRRKYRERFRAMDAPCGICKGRLGPIHYDEPSDAKHPLSFVIDEIHPVSKWMRYGYGSPQEAAQDWANLQAAHYCCNQAKGARDLTKGGYPTGGAGAKAFDIMRNMIPQDGDW